MNCFQKQIIYQVKINRLITHYYDKGKDKGALIVAEFETHHSNGTKLFTSIATVFARPTAWRNVNGT